MSEDNARRTTASLTARWEKKNLPKMARALPEWVTPDHLTALGIVSAFVIAGGFIAARFHPVWLALVIVGLVFHWLGDSLDGTLARVRNKTRERYGYYVDRTADAVSTVVIGIGFGLSPYVHLEVAMLLTISYLLLMMYAEICAYTSREFPLSFGAVGPTEARIALAAFTGVLMFAQPRAVSLFGVTGTWVDLLIVLVSAGLLVTFGVSSWQQAKKLDALDRRRWRLAHESASGPTVE
jgi:phosphatidylglycerophosphate synthase